MRVIFFGTDRDGSLKCIQYLRSTRFLDVVACVCTNSPILTSYCNKVSIPVYTMQEIETIIPQMELDFGISYLYNYKITNNALKHVREGIINFHPSPLPFHKGVAGCCYAILNDFSEWGVTAHYIDSYYDTGPIIRAKNFSILGIKNAFFLERKIQKYLYMLFIELIKIIENKQSLPVGTEQEGGGHYFSRNDLQALKKVTLEEDNDMINKKINGLWLPPYEGAYIEQRGERFYLINKEILEEIAALYTNQFTRNTNLTPKEINTSEITRTGTM